MIVYSEKIYEKSFTDTISKNAYMKACKWLAINVYGKGDLPKYITVKLTKQQTKKKDKTKFIVELFATINENEVQENFCYKCKHLHTIFYSIDKPECQKCNMFVYRQRLSEQLKGIKEFCNSIVEEVDD